MNPYQPGTYGANSNGTGGFRIAPTNYINGGNFMSGPMGNVPVYNTSPIVYSNKSNASWDDYGAYKDMAKETGDPVFAAAARIEADAQWKALTSQSNTGHEYYKNLCIYNLEGL